MLPSDADFHNGSQLGNRFPRGSNALFAGFNIIVLDVFNYVIAFGIERTKEKLLHISDHLLAFGRISIDCPVHITADSRFRLNHIFLFGTNFQQVRFILVRIHKRVPRSIKAKALHQDFFIRLNELVFCLLKLFQSIFQLAVAAFKFFLDTSEFFTRSFDFTIDVIQCTAF